MSEALSTQIISDLQHKNWNVRNGAIKQLAKIKSPATMDSLINFIKDRRPASFWRRLMGEKYYQVGFSRRNAWDALREQAIGIDEILPILDIGFSDPYYEVQSSTWTTLGHALRKSNIKLPLELQQQLKNRLTNEDNFEITMAALSTAELIFSPEELLKFSVNLEKFKHWRVRASYLECLGRAVKLGQITGEMVEKQLKAFNLRSEYFRPIFMLKEKGAQLEQMIKYAPS